MDDTILIRHHVCFADNLNLSHLRQACDFRCTSLTMCAKLICILESNSSERSFQDEADALQGNVLKHLHRR